MTPLHHDDFTLLESKFVTKEEFIPVKELVIKHHKVYNRVQNLLIYIGILATFQLIFGQTWERALVFLKFVAGK